MEKNNFTSIESIISVAKKGGMFILVEMFLLANQKQWLDPLVKRILQITNFLDKI